ncbi:MAG: pitrilysin family protein [Candidatus Sericytochromatia bacterium]|nr:pitrilysin family protein [Candidatus Sericytochromatia bacterium]
MPRSPLGLMVAVLGLASGTIVGGPLAASAAPGQLARASDALPRPEKLTIGSGLPLHVVRRPGMPVVTLLALVRTGSAQDPQDRIGLASLAGALLKRGAAGRTGAEIDEMLDAVGADVAVEVDDDRMLVRFTGLSEHLDLGTTLLADMLTRPDFPAAELELARDQRLAAMRSTLDDANAIVGLAAARNHFGTHPYAHPGQGTRSGLGAITTADLLRFRDTAIRPGNIEFVAVGDLDPQRLATALRTALGSWREGPRADAARPLPPHRVSAGRRVLFVPMPVTQAYIQLDLPSVARRHPDHLPLAVMAYILGGSSRGRLYADIRDKQGLAYGAYASQQAQAAEGRLVLELQTKTASAGKAIDSLLGQMRRMAEQGPTRTELEAAKEYLTGSWGSRFESGADVAGQVAAMRFHDLGEDWFRAYPERIRSLTASRIQGVAAQYLRTGRYSLTVVGPEESVAPGLGRFGTVTRTEATSLLD